ncbi:uncharacterized protein LOC134784505 [Penaeus indicus]|uniref:uncharacterized protein LOC134784505 n=1 Tax=Penaeus indicus TaxID=29960 RepID=UPI00300C8C56
MTKPERAIQTPNVKSLMVLAVTAALMCTLHVTYNSHNYIYVPPTATTSKMKAAVVYGPMLTNATRKGREQVTNVPRLTRKNTRTEEATDTPPGISTARTENKEPLPIGARGNVPIPFLQVTLPATSQTLHKSLLETNSTYRTANANFTHMDSQTLTETDLKMEPSQQPASEPQATASAQNLTVIQRDYSRKPSVLWPQDANCSSMGMRSIRTSVADLTPGGQGKYDQWSPGPADLTLKLNDVENESCSCVWTYVNKRNKEGKRTSH